MVDKADKKLSDIEQEVLNIIIEQLGVEPQDVTSEKSFVEDLNADSLDLTELIMTFEERFGFEISEEEAVRFLQFGFSVDLTLRLLYQPAA